MNKSIIVDNLSDEEVLALIQALAAANPDATAVLEELAPMNTVPLTKGEQSRLARETLTVLIEDAQQVQAIESLLNNADLRQFNSNRSNIPIVIALVILLGTHIQYQKTSNGDWSFQFEYNPANESLTLLLKELGKLLPAK